VKHPEFETYTLSGEGKARADRVAEIFNEALTQLLAIVPPGRHLAVTKTKLEEACFFAKKAVAADATNQVTP